MFTVGNTGAGHPQEDALEQYVMGKLDGSASETIEDHIMICASCQDRVELTETYVVSMKSALKSAQIAPAESSWRDTVAGWFQMPAPVWAGAAAVVVLGVAGVIGTQYFGKTGTPVAVALTATRGETASVAAKGPLDLDLDTRDLAPAASYKVQMVNVDGKTVWEQTSANVADGHVHVRVDKRLAAGQYFVRIFSAEAGTPREYAIQIR